MNEPNDRENEPKFRSGPMVVWISVGIAVIWAALLLYIGYGPGTEG